MPGAFGDGWLIAIVALFISILVPLMRWVAGRWREARDAAIKRAEKAEAENEVLKNEAVKRTEVLYEVKIENMLLKSKLELCESNLENWQSGRWEQPK